MQINQFRPAFKGKIFFDQDNVIKTTKQQDAKIRQAMEEACPNLYKKWYQEMGTSDVVCFNNSLNKVLKTNKFVGTYERVISFWKDKDVVVYGNALIDLGDRDSVEKDAKEALNEKIKELQELESKKLSMTEYRTIIEDIYSSRFPELDTSFM